MKLKLSKKIVNQLKKSDEPIAIVCPLNFNGILFIKSLAKENIPCIGILNDKRDPSYWTKYCNKILFNYLEDKRLVDLLIKLGKIAKLKPALFPIGDIQVLLFSRYRKELEKYFLLNLAKRKDIDLLMNKIKFSSWAKMRKLPIPNSFELKNKKDMETISKKIKFPCILKPKYKNKKWLNMEFPKVFKIKSPDELKKKYEFLRKYEKRFLISEWVPGPDSNIYTCHTYLCKNQNLLISYVDQKLRQCPPHTGSGCLIISNKNKCVETMTKNIIKGLNFYGFGGIEMKKEQFHNKYKIIEPFSGRPCSHIYISEIDKINFPFIAYCDLTNKKINFIPRQSNKKLKYIYEETDPAAALNYMKNKELKIIDYLNSLKNIKIFVYFSLLDPLPGIYLIFTAFKNLTKKILKW